MAKHPTLKQRSKSRKPTQSEVARIGHINVGANGMVTVVDHDGAVMEALGGPSEEVLPHLRAVCPNIPVTEWRS